MPVRPLIPWPDKRLRTPAEPVSQITPEIEAIWDDMVETMDAMPGYGLAAPQIGVGLALAVVDCSEERGRAVRMANPEIIDVSEEMFAHAEASPNLRGVSVMMERPAKITVAFMDHHGIRVRRSFMNLWATSVQHQIDHLAGKMYFDRLSRVKREMLIKKARKLGA